MAKGTILASAAMEKLLKRAGAERVSADAKEEMIKVLEEYSREIGQKAVRLAKHAGRKTVKAEDIYEATRQ